MSHTGYESLGTLTSLDSRVDHLRETITWALEHPGTAAHDPDTFNKYLSMALAEDEAHEMNRKYDEAVALDNGLTDVARRKVAALDALNEMGF